MTTECPRCGAEVKGTGGHPSKTPFCQPCASTLSNRKRWSCGWAAGRFQPKPRIKRHVTLPEGWR